MKEWSARICKSGKTIALVPTMGFFHEGHLTLMRKGKSRSDHLVVSLFVNPTQFGPNEDFEAYPRDPDRDAALADSEGVDILFTPHKDAFYPQGFETYIVQEQLPQHLCGLSRPGHFRGVLTIVAKLFHVVAPQIAVFGEKDYQQLSIIRKMVKDLNFNIEIIGCPTHREADGLAMSSRNARLSEMQRKSAVCLIEALRQCKDQVLQGEKDTQQLMDTAEQVITSYPDTLIDYISICDPDTLDPVSILSGPSLMALAVKLGHVRLIDNMILAPKENEP